MVGLDWKAGQGRWHVFPPRPSPSLLLGLLSSQGSCPRSQGRPQGRLDWDTWGWGAEGWGAQGPLATAGQPGGPWPSSQVTSAETPQMFSLLSSTLRKLTWQALLCQKSLCTALLRTLLSSPVPKLESWLTLVPTAGTQLGLQPGPLSWAEPGPHDLPARQPVMALTSCWLVLSSALTLQPSWPH